MMNTSDDSSRGAAANPVIAAIAAAPQAICFHLDSDGTILDHQGGAAAGNAPLQAFLGKRLPDLLPLEGGASFSAGLGRALETGETVAIEFELPLTTERTTFEARLIPFYSGKAVAVIRNITLRRRTQEITRLVEERFHTIFRNSSAGMVLGAPDGTFIEVNPAFCHFLGYTADELLKLTVEEITHPDDREMSRRERSTSLEGIRSSYTYEKRYLRKDGSTVWGQLSGNWFYDADGEPVYAVGIIQDITERKRVEMALSESEAKFAKVFHATPTWLVISTLRDGQFIEINDAFEHICGYRRQEVIGRSSLDLDIWENPEDRARVIASLLEGEKVRDLEVNFKGKGGSTFVGLLSAELIDINGEQQLLTLVNDITARKRAEEALRQNEERYRHLYNDTPVMLHSVDRNGILLSVSNHWLEVLGYERSEVIGHMSTEFLSAESCHYAEEVVLPEYFRTGFCKDIPYQFVTRGGRAIDVLLSATAERDDAGGIIRSLAVLTDVTDQKRAEEKIEELNTDLAARAAELEAANQELEAFNYTVAHDLRGPLTVISGYSQAIQELCGANLDDDCRRYLAETYKGALRMNQLIDALLNFSRLSHIEPHRETVDISAVAREIAGELQLTRPERRVGFRIADGIEAEGDPKLLRIVLGNLIGNAWKYTGMREEAAVDFGVTEVDGKPAYFVRDNGAGFDREDAARLFIPFQRLHGPEQFKGFGIGLATVERIIRRHGGKIWAEGKPGEGAIFYFTLGGERTV